MPCTRGSASGTRSGAVWIRKGCSCPISVDVFGSLDPVRDKGLESSEAAGHERRHRNATDGRRARRRLRSVPGDPACPRRTPADLRSPHRQDGSSLEAAAEELRVSRSPRSRPSSST